MSLSSCHYLSQEVIVVVVVEVGEGEIRYWYWPGWKGGNTKNKAGKGDKVLVLGDYLGSQKVGEGGELCLFH